MEIEHPPTDRRRLSPLKIASYAGFAAGVMVLVCVLGLLFLTDPLLNRFARPRITASFAESYPGYSLGFADMKYSFVRNRLEFHSVELSAADSTFSGTIGTFSVGGIGWLHLLRGGTLEPFVFASSILAAQDVVLNFPGSQYELRCGLLRVSVPDSEMVADALMFHPAADDKQFFAESRFRQTRLNLKTQQCRLAGIPFLEALDRKIYRARSIHILDMSLDILINKDKPARRDSAAPRMPNELLSSMREILQWDSMDISNAALIYGERFGAGPKPAIIRFDSMQVGVEWIASRSDGNDTVVIRAQGEFMKSARTKIFMSIPVSSSEFSLRYAGSVEAMDLRALNAFLEIAEQQRVKSGTLQLATFDISVVAGRASGSVRAQYNDLALAAINKHTGSEKGFVDALTSYFAKNYILRGANRSERSGLMKIGRVNYVRQRDDPFFRFWWFALRSGVGDIVGF